VTEFGDCIGVWSEYMLKDTCYKRTENILVALERELWLTWIS
jgi:hypothetical protein